MKMYFAVLVLMISGSALAMGQNTYVDSATGFPTDKAREAWMGGRLAASKLDGRLINYVNTNVSPKDERGAVLGSSKAPAVGETSSVAQTRHHFHNENSEIKIEVEIKVRTALPSHEEPPPESE